VTLFDTAQAYGFGASERLLANPNVHTAIVGTRNPGHTDDAIAAADLNLGADVLAQIDRILTAAAPTGGPTPDSV
jgi:aryl-alcohol dehydrogenase-like predicted oxidoreductase